ncbi:MAG: sugar transferase [Oscillatoriales cyanobacterium C42_A2020_001]|nr:sugar transferase [Leptolyngbyaceae cyanobacterium C42_A2020_001]
MVESNGNDCQVTILEKTCRISIPPVFTVKKALEFKQSFQQACQNNPDLTHVSLDFSETKFMDSSGIGALVASRKLAQKQGFELVLQNVSQQVLSALALADLDKFFVIEQAPPAPKTSTSTAAANASSDRLPRGTAASLSSPSAKLVPKRFRNMVKSEEQPFITHPSVKSVPKRVMDVVGALIGLAITAVLFPFIAIAIKLDSRGPIFFGQVRCSQMGKRFKMWKFRSMCTDAEAKKHLVQNEAEGAIFKAKNDPRITRVGRILRKTSLDELPQFWNVLKGEMSLVGTRPPTPDEVEKYEILQWQRLDIKPGMTGEWQVNGRSSVKNFEDIVRLDLKYQENWSLKYDVELIFKTIWVIFNKNSGAM